MLIGASEGQGWRYEVIERPDDYLVRMRDLDTGALEESDGKLFRTAAVAFAYAELSAAFATPRLGWPARVRPNWSAPCRLSGRSMRISAPGSATKACRRRCWSPGSIGPRRPTAAAFTDPRSAERDLCQAARPCYRAACLKTYGLPLPP